MLAMSWLLLEISNTIFSQSVSFKSLVMSLAIPMCWELWLHRLEKIQPQLWILQPPAASMRWPHFF